MGVHFSDYVLYYAVNAVEGRKSGTGRGSLAVGSGILVSLTENLRLTRLEGNEGVSRWVFGEVTGGWLREAEA